MQISFKNGPRRRLPYGAALRFVITAALCPKRSHIPQPRKKIAAVRTTKAREIAPDLNFLFWGSALFMTTIMILPGNARCGNEPPSNFMHWASLAPQLSATFNFVKKETIIKNLLDIELKKCKLVYQPYWSGFNW